MSKFKPEQHPTFDFNKACLNAEKQLEDFETKLFFATYLILCNAYASFVLHAVMLVVECLRCEPAAGEPQVGPPVSTLNTRNDLIHSVLYCRSETQLKLN